MRRAVMRFAVMRFAVMRCAVAGRAVMRCAVAGRAVMRCAVAGRAVMRCAVMRRAVAAARSADLGGRLPDDVNAGQHGCRDQRTGQQPGVDGRVVGGQQAAADGRAEHGLRLAALPCSEAAHGNAEGLLESLILAEDGQVIRVIGDLQRASLPVPGWLAGQSGELGGERRIAALRFAAKPEQLLLGVRGLRNRRDHSRRGVRRATAWLRIGYRHPQAALSGPPGNAQPDDPAADDQYVGSG